MRTWHNMPVGDFIRDLREAAIKGGMKTSFIDMVDELTDPQEWEAKCGELEEDISNKEKTCDDLAETIRMLVKAMLDLDPENDAKAWKATLQEADDALSRAES